MAAPSMAVARVKREVQEVRKDKQIAECHIKLELPSEADLTHLEGEIPGPPDSPYEGGTFRLEIRIPGDYPFAPPKVKFITKIWHPNISSVTGAICLDILKDQWAAAMTLRTVLLSVQQLLTAAEPDDPQDAVVARQYKSDPAAFKRQAAEWTQAHAASAAAPSADDVSLTLTAGDRDKLAQLQGMGFPAEAAFKALAAKDWDLAAALDHLCA